MTFLRRIFGKSPRPKTSSDAKSRSGAVTRTASAAVKKYEEKDSTIHYLDRTALERIHAVLTDFAMRNGDEPIPSIHLAKAAEIESLLAAPKHRFFGIEAYPTIEEKAAILFYTINKRQTFLNGNKRMSTLTLLVFLGINGSTLTVSPDELTEKALWLANTPSLEFPAIKKNLASWIRDHLIAMPPEHA
jgi:death-on-curing family protein